MMGASEPIVSMPCERFEFVAADAPHVRQEVWFNAPTDAVFNALFDAAQFAAMSGAPARNNAIRGGKFSYFGGMVEGANFEVLPPSLVVQSWRLRHWPRDCFSIVASRLNDESGGTRFLLQQWGFPEGQQLEPLWDRMYWIPMQRFLADRRNRPRCARRALDTSGPSASLST